MVELCGPSSTGRASLAVSLVMRAQAAGEPVAWVQPEGGPLYPPDLAEAGVDLGAVIVVHVPTGAGRGAVGTELVRATEMLLRSGGFGLVVLDLTWQRPSGPPARWQGRLAGQLRQHSATLVLLSDGDAEGPSLGPMVGLRVAPQRRRRVVQAQQRSPPGADRAGYEVVAEVLRDKVGLGQAIASVEFRAPAGL